MYIIPVTLQNSPIDGKGVFASQDIKKGTIVWQFTKGHDLMITVEQFAKATKEEKELLHHSAYLSPWSGYWICPPENDPAHFTNHSAQHNLSTRYDSQVSPEPYFVANRDIAAGEELTNNYHEFDRITQETNPTWAQ
jgi:SET domain-containing protein